MPELGTMSEGVKDYYLAVREAYQARASEGWIEPDYVGHVLILIAEVERLRTFLQRIVDDPPSQCCGCGVVKDVEAEAARLLNGEAN